MMRVLVTGGSGFIGVNLITALARRGADILNLDAETPRDTSQTHLWRQRDIRDREGLAQDVREFAPTHIVHLAALATFHATKAELDACNIDGTVNLLDAARDHAPGARLIVTSTQYVNGPGTPFDDDTKFHPVNDYGASKVGSELAARESKYAAMDWVIVRPTNIWGAYHPRFPVEMWKYIRQGFYMHPGHRPIMRAYGYVGNVVRQIEILLDAPAEKVRHRVFSKANNLRVIEDAAHSFGNDRSGVKVGAEGDIVCFSFDGIKNITSGEGGAIVTGDAALAQRLRDARLLGVEKDTDARYGGRRSWTFDVKHQGFRYHMSNLMAALGRAQLKKLDRFAARRRALATRYVRAFAGLNGLLTLDLEWAQIVPHIFVVRIPGGMRDALAETLKAQEIETGFHYQPNHRLSFFKTDYPLPVAERLADELLTLPMHAELTDEEQDRVIAAIVGFFRPR